MVKWFLEALEALGALGVEMQNQFSVNPASQAFLPRGSA
jgi:hypothetical protein